MFYYQCIQAYQEQLKSKILFWGFWYTLTNHLDFLHYWQKLTNIRLRSRKRKAMCCQHWPSELPSAASAGRWGRFCHSPCLSPRPSWTESSWPSVCTHYLCPHPGASAWCDTSSQSDHNSVSNTYFTLLKDFRRLKKMCPYILVSYGSWSSIWLRILEHCCPSYSSAAPPQIQKIQHCHWLPKASLQWPYQPSPGQWAELLLLATPPWPFS